MAGRGQSIIVTSDPKGRFNNGILSGALKPGTHLQVNAAYGIDSDDRMKYEVYGPGTDGKQMPIILLLENRYLGVLMTVAYTTLDTVDVYTPVSGEEVNCLKGDVAGTADDFAIGDRLMIDDTTGKVIATTGSPQSNPYVCLETITDPTADVLVHCLYAGD